MKKSIKLRRAYYKLLDQKRQEITLLIIFIIAVAVIGMAAKIEAYDNNISINSGLRRSDNNLSERSNNKAVEVDGENVSNSEERRLIKGFGEIALCSLDDVVCPNEKVIREITAYNLGDPNQTDDSPCIMASGLNGCELLEKGIKICAANFVPFHTKLNIDNFGECEVLDRMASRFINRVDVGMRLDEKERALIFGKQNLAVAIIE